MSVSTLKIGLKSDPQCFITRDISIETVKMTRNRNDRMIPKVNWANLNRADLNRA
jgi:hypothetical protein